MYKNKLYSQNPPLPFFFVTTRIAVYKQTTPFILIHVDSTLCQRQVYIYTYIRIKKNKNLFFFRFIFNSILLCICLK